MKGFLRNIRSSPIARFPVSAVFICALISESFSQTSDSHTVTLNSNYFSEELYITTDRDIYISGELVYLKVFCSDRLTQRPSDFSKVAYVSLLDHSANPVSQVKIWMNGSSGSGELLIPDTLRTGNYYISSCTHWMRNFSPDLFACRKISVINPFINIEHIRVPPREHVPDTTLAVSVNTVSEAAVDGRPESDKILLPVFNVNVDKSVFRPREKVGIQITTEDPEGDPVESDLMVTVVKSFTHDRTGQTSLCSFISPAGQAAGPSGREPLYLPEPEGHLISGVIYNTVTGEPLARENMVLSLVGKSALCRFTKTDENGVFNFIIRELGRHEIVIQPLRRDLPDYYIELNDPFPQVYNRYEPPHFFIDTARLSELNEAIVSMQVQAIYKPLMTPATNASKQSRAPDFYGEPDYSVRLADFIELKSVREIARELVQVIGISSADGKSSIRMNYKSPDGTYLETPLVLVDGVPAYDHDAVLNLSPDEIEKINVLNNRYYISDISLGGIIDIKTVKGNVSVTENGLHVLRQEFEAPFSGTSFYSPEYLSVKQRESRIPDYRNTLYWNPDIKTDRYGKAVAEFYTSDEPGDYLVFIEGFTAGGLKGSAFTIISVTDR
ncbi:MAG: hypothetical protein WAV93_02795 [Bacteroidales bacterium]